MRIVLIGNYPKDAQESMERFAQMLKHGFGEAGLGSEIWRPRVFFGKPFKSTSSGVGKWAGYLDKWVLFPIILKNRLLDKNFRTGLVRFHVCDHSNSPYLKHLPKDTSAVTCHDVLAIRGAFGYADAYCPASTFGVLLQKWILKNLKQAKRLAAVSQLTLDQLEDLSGKKVSGQKNWRVIHNGFNAAFNPLDTSEIKHRLLTAGLDPDKPFLLHVGSGLERKNRKLLIDMVAALGEKWNGVICFAGKAVDEALLAHAKALDVQDRIVSVVKPSHAVLEALYNACDAFVFPSFSEGFGWPVIEAQACGAPVIASSYAPMPEVSGGAALHADPTNPNEFANAFLSLQDDRSKRKIIARGHQNALRFQPRRMIEQYLQLHGLPRTKIKEPCLPKS